MQRINVILNLCIHFSKTLLQSDFELYGSMRRNRQSAWDLNDNRQTRLSTFQVPSAQATAIENDQSMRLRSSQDRSFDFYSHRSPSYEVKRKFGHVAARSCPRFSAYQPIVVFYKDRDTGSSSDEELIVSEANRNSWAGVSVEWPFVIYKEISNGHAIPLYTSTCKQMNKPQTEGRRAFKTPMQELGCCKDCSHYHSQPVLQRYSQFYQARRHHKNSHQLSSPQVYPTEKMKALRISPDHAHWPFTPQRNSHQHFQTQGVLQGCSNESRRPDPSKLKAKEIIRSYSYQPRAFTASQTADMSCKRNHVNPDVIIRAKGEIKDADHAAHTNTTLTTKPTVKVIHTIQQVTDGDPVDTTANTCEQRHLKQPTKSLSHSHRPTTTDTNSSPAKRTPGNRQRFSRQPTGNQKSPCTLLSNDSNHHIYDTGKNQPNGDYICSAKTASGKGVHNPSEAATQRIGRDSRPPPSQQFATRRNGTVISTPVSKGRESWSRIKCDFPQQSRNEPCEATGNQWRRRRIGVCLDTDATQEQRRFTRVLAKRF